MNKFNREIFHNRDIKYKICLINHVQYIFDLEGIEEKVVHIIPTEFIDKDYSNKRLDFAVECESGNIYDIECETSSVNDETADKTWDYAKNLHCRYDNKIYSLIIALAEKNDVPIKKIGTTTHKPLILEMKKYDGDKYLNNIKKKFDSKKELTSHDCAFIETIPDMRNSKQPDTIVEELCHIIKYGEIIIDNRIKLQATMELNIDYYVEDCKKRDELMEMIDVETSQDSEYFKWQETYGNRMKKIGKKEIITKLLRTMSSEDIAKKLDMDSSEIEKIAK